MQLYRTTFRAMGCHCEIAVDAAMAKADAIAAMQQAAREVLRIEAKYSRYRNDDASIVHRINQAAGTSSAVACDGETMELLQTAARLHQISGGLFDITSGVLRRAWNFSVAAVPADAVIEPLLALVGWQRVEVGSGSIRLPLPGMEIDFGGFGKEYAADRAAAVLVRNGVEHGYVNLGGDIHAIGGQPDGRPWTFGVSDPRNKAAMVGKVAVTAGGLATSGDYEKFFEKDSVRYCHILNPKTGFPVHCWRSVSVTDLSTLQAGALTTIAMLKEADAVKFLDTMQCGYLLVDESGRLLSNSHTGNAEQT